MHRICKSNLELKTERAGTDDKIREDIRTAG